ncbi:MAG: conjugative transfer signal peptidase TraF [Acidobacteria bacterium]|nr:MAG: conjugative transfer signal peptidase TraF [Acidobacteriota bacterium]
MGRLKEMNLAANVSERRARIRHALIYVFLLATMFLALVSTCALFGVRFNVSESLPGLIYIVTSDNSSPVVEFCPVGSFAELSKERGYRRRGICPDGASPMLKPIVAHAGDTVEVSAHGIAINGTLLHNTAPRTTDSRGRTLTPWRFGKYGVAPGFVWVASQYNPLSFDSRYYGPILVSQIRHHLRPL